MTFEFAERQNADEQLAGSYEDGEYAEPTVRLPPPSVPAESDEPESALEPEPPHAARPSVAATAEPPKNARRVTAEFTIFFMSNLFLSILLRPRRAVLW